MNQDIYKYMIESFDGGVILLDEERRVQYCNEAAAKISGYKHCEIVGRFCHDFFICRDFNDRIISRGKCMLEEVLEGQRYGMSEMFLLHQSGQNLPVIVSDAAVKDSSGKIIGAVRTFFESSARYQMNQKLQKLEDLAYLDPLTGLANRRYTEAVLSSRFAEFRRYGWIFSVILFDVDDFKTVNDNYGHLSGDMVLQKLGKIFKNGLRSSDIIGRWGGDEFMAILRNIQTKDLYQVAEKFRILVEQTVFHGDNQEKLSITISVGATEVKEGDTIPGIIDRADRLLYQSKSYGRNRSKIG